MIKHFKWHHVSTFVKSITNVATKEDLLTCEHTKHIRVYGIISIYANMDAHSDTLVIDGTMSYVLFHAIASSICEYLLH